MSAAPPSSVSRPFALPFRRLARRSACHDVPACGMSYNFGQSDLLFSTLFIATLLYGLGIHGHLPPIDRVVLFLPRTAVLPTTGFLL